MCLETINDDNEGEKEWVHEKRNQWMCKMDEQTDNWNEKKEK